MGYKEAQEDGIQHDGRVFLIPCHVCGENIVRSYSYSRKRKYTCQLCKDVAKAKEDPEKMHNKEIKFRNAISRIEMQIGNMADYQDAIQKVYKTLHHAGWYNSTEEMMAAIELIQKGIKTIHQQKIDRYRVDFVLPDYKVLLEIDGQPFHGDLKREGRRDSAILLRIGLDWEIIRIGTDKINKDIQQLVPAIEAILEHRKAEYLKYRKK